MVRFALMANRDNHRSHLAKKGKTFPAITDDPGPFALGCGGAGSSNSSNSNNRKASSETASAWSDPPDWQTVLADAVRDPAELCRLLELDPSLVAQAKGPSKGFSLLVPRTYLARIRPGDPADPLLLQVLPQAAEQTETVGFGLDPLGEAEATASPGLLWKYQGRALILSTGACAVHCRFCFRRHFPYQTPSRVVAGLEPALRRIAAEPSIHEVILSGGDPLTLPDEHLAALAGRFVEIKHLRRVRIHTSMPLMVPQRVTEGLLRLVRGGNINTIVVIHINHPREIDDAVAMALGRLVDAGIPVLSQSVLLRGVNDRTDILAELYERLIDLRVMPYYLHQLDSVAGAAHFRVPESTGVNLIEQLRQRLPGYAVPRYVREVCGETSKRRLA